MKIILSTTLLLVLLSGCTSSAQSSGLFQSVTANKAVILHENKENKSCIKCGMKLPKFYKTNHAATHKGEIRQYCSLHCLVADINEGNTLKNPKVVDVSSLQFIDASQAHYVVGSKKRGTMSHISKYAFKELPDAKSFQSEFGGKILDMYQAIERAQKDFR